MVFVYLRVIKVGWRAKVAMCALFTGAAFAEFAGGHYLWGIGIVAPVLLLLCVAVAKKSSAAEKP